MKLYSVPPIGERVKNPRDAMPVSEPIPLTGCRHDLFGHALKACGILRALNVCAADGHADPDAEAWWDTDTGIFQIRSPKYPTPDQLIGFFEKHYRPTPIFSPWNKGGGLDDKQEVVITFTKDVQSKTGVTKAGKPTEEDVTNLVRFLFKNRSSLAAAGLEVRKKIRSVRQKLPTKGDFYFVVEDSVVVARLEPTEGVNRRIQQKTTGEKAVMANVERVLASDAVVQEALRLGRDFFIRFQASETYQERRELLARYRDQLDDRVVPALDAVFATHTIRTDENPAFLERGKAGNSEIFRSFWSYFLEFRKQPRSQVEAALWGGTAGQFEGIDAPGAPFFPDQIKTYNNGLTWVLQMFPFCALDYLLAVEGALALRGSAARLLGARNGNFGAFPFIFETADDMTDDSGAVQGTALSLWLPVWNCPATFVELESFILDSQARLPGREARFTAEFARAIRSQGVDAGFAGYQEFRFKMKGARVPWVCTGRYLATNAAMTLTDTAELLRPLDETGFLDQLRLHEKSGRSSPHRFPAKILDAMEYGMSEGEPHRFLTILERLFEVTQLLTTSKRFRAAVSQPVFPRPLPQEPWLEALRGLEVEPEFEIARALASIVGHTPQRDGTRSNAEPFLGSILPLTLGRNSWYLSETPSPQAVWSGSDLCLDLSRVLARRYHDSRTDDQPALASPFPARLSTILRFIHGELDEARITRYAEALSLIGWHFTSTDRTKSQNQPQEMVVVEPSRPLPLAYAAIRSLLETELMRRQEEEKRRRCDSLRTLALLRERSSGGTAAATSEALHRLSIIGVPNPYDDQVRKEKPNLTGCDIVRVEPSVFLVAESLISRLAAAACIPLHWRDRFRLFRNVTLPQTKEFNKKI